MVNDALTFLRDRLNGHLTPAGGGDAAPQADRVDFPGAGATDSIALKADTVSALLINIEQERTLRDDDPFLRRGADGSRRRVAPDIRLNLYVLFVAHFGDYQLALRQLSSIIGYFHTHQVFDRHNAPELTAAIQHLVVELASLPIEQQNDLWAALRIAYRPSVLYRVGVLTLVDEGTRDAPLVTEPIRNVRPA